MNCPNPDLLSAFFDGEVQSPWSERIQQHIGECTHCRRALQKLESLQGVLRADEEPSFQEAQRRTRERLSSIRPARRRRARRFWRTRIVVPLPAMAAMLLVLLGMGTILLLFATRPNFPFMSIRRQPSGITEVQVAAPIEDLEQLLKSLDQEPGNQQIVITLPDDTEFLQFGEPEMVRAEEYSRRVR